MGNRLSKLATRTGDNGQTGISGNLRLEKFHPRIHAIGDVDELNCCIGLLRAQSIPEEIDTCLERVQQELFNLGGELAMPDMSLITASMIAALDTELDYFNSELPPLKEFVLPGGGLAASHAHLARAVCRRAERSCWACNAEETLNSELPQYLNRLSDLLFVFCRLLARQAGASETQWLKPQGESN